MDVRLGKSLGWLTTAPAKSKLEFARETPHYNVGDVEKDVNETCSYNGNSRFADEVSHHPVLLFDAWTRRRGRKESENREPPTGAIRRRQSATGRLPVRRGRDRLFQRSRV